MSETINLPRYGACQARMKLERAEALINAFYGLYEYLVALFTRGNPAAKEDDALTLCRASTGASA